MSATRRTGTRAGIGADRGPDPATGKPARGQDRRDTRNPAAVALNAIHQARMAERAPGSKLPGLTEAGRDARRRNVEKARSRLAEIREAEMDYRNEHGAGAPD